MALFNDPNSSDLILIFNDVNQTSKQLYCHRNILINGSEYFNILLNKKFKESNQKEIPMYVDDIEVDIKIIESIYRGYFPDISSYSTDQKINLAIRANFYFLDMIVKKIIADIYKNLLVSEVTLLINCRDKLPLDKEKLMDYISFFFTRIEKINDLLDDLMKIDSRIVEGIVLKLIDEPTFYSSLLTSGDLDDNIGQIFYKLQNIKYPKYRKGNLFMLNHFIIYQLMDKYGFTDLMGLLNYNKMNVTQLNYILDNSKNISVIRNALQVIKNSTFMCRIVHQH